MNCSKISPTYIQIFINTDYPVSFHSNLPKGSSNKNENYPLLQGHYFNILVYCYFLSPLSSILLPNINLLQLTFPDIPRVPSILKINPNIVLHRYLNLHSVMQEITEKCWKNLGVTWTTEFHTSHYMVTNLTEYWEKVLQKHLLNIDTGNDKLIKCFCGWLSSSFT